jgi:phospholipid/cholesterol/gamma-HCH transport system permease protein
VHANEQTSLVTFIHGAFVKISFPEIISSLARSLIFGFTIGIIGCYKGYTTTQGTEGVGRAANVSVVIIMFLLFIEEIIIVQFMNWINPGG